MVIIHQLFWQWFAKSIGVFIKYGVLWHCFVWLKTHFCILLSVHSFSASAPPCKLRTPGGVLLIGFYWQLSRVKSNCLYILQSDFNSLI